MTAAEQCVPADNPETSALIDRIDWSATPLGPRLQWSAELSLLVRLMLRSKAPQHLVWGPQRVLIYNDGYIPLLGVKHPGAMGAAFEDVWPELWAEMEPIVARTYAGQASYYENRPFMLRRQAVEEVAWISFAYTPVEDALGRIVGFHSHFFETTSAVLADMSRSAETERLRRMFDQAPGFIAVLAGPDHVFELANAAYMQLVGHRPIIGRPVREVLPEVVDQGFIALLDAVRDTGEPYVGRRVPITLRRDPEGAAETRYIDFIYQPLVDGDGTVSGIFLQGSDVTGQHHAENELRSVSEALRRANQRKDEFLATLAHELRNPLAPIRTGLAVLGRAPTPEVAEHTRQIMDRQLGHLVRLVDDLLDIARINTDKITLQPELVDVAHLVQSAVEASRPLLEAAGHQLFVSLPAAGLQVEVDSTRMVQVLSNLLNNAGKYTATGGRIEVVVQRQGTEVTVSVRDDGIGIAPEHLPDIFNLFSQVGHAYGRSEGGLGIGLALVKRIVAMHGGSVQAHSEGVGKGTTVTVRLPMAVPASDAGAATGSIAPVAARSASRKVLVVDDNVDGAETVRCLLQLLGHDVQVAHDGRSALQAFAAQAPDLVLLDIGLPDMDGYEVSRRIHAAAPTSPPMIVAMTGWGAPEDVARTRAGGFHGHLTKPVDPGEIEALLAKMADRLP